MNKQKVVIELTQEDLYETLDSELNFLEDEENKTEITDEMLESFIEWTKRDVGQWLVDNAKSFINSQFPIEPIKCDECGRHKPPMTRWIHDNGEIEFLCQDCAKELGVKEE